MANVYDGVIYGEYSKYTRLRINYTVSQDTATAISSISMTLYAERTKGSEQYNNTGAAYWSMTGTGNNYANFTWAASSLELKLGTSSTTVQHNPDGTGSVTLNGYWYTGRTGSSYIPEAISISQGITLQTIPRASSVSGGTGNIGSTSTISISRASSSFTHTLRYAFGSLSGTIATGVGTSYTWTIPTSFYAQIPSAKSGTGTIYCDTYNGSTLIGTKSVSFTATATESNCRPTVSATITDTNSTTIALTGNSSKLVKYKSTAQLVITSAVKNSASIKSVTVNGTNVGTSSSITVNYSNVSTASFTIVVTDSRGYTNTSYVLTPSYVSYMPLTINANFFRPQPTTGEVQLTYSGNYFDDSFGIEENTLSITWAYKIQGDSDWIDGGTITPTISDNKISPLTISLGTIFDYQTAYDFQLVATDKLTTITTTSTVSVGMPVFYWGKDFFNVNAKVQATGQFIRNSGGIYIAARDNSTIRNNRHGQSAGNSFNALATQKTTNGAWTIGNLSGEENLCFLYTTDANYNAGNNISTSVILPATHYGTIQLEPVSLYDNASGTNGAVPLSETAANFTYLDIFYRCYDSHYNSVKVYSPNGKEVWLSSGYIITENNGGNVKFKVVYISGTSISTAQYVEHSLSTAAENRAANYIYITKVIGYR